MPAETAGGARTPGAASFKETPWSRRSLQPHRYACSHG